MVCLFQLSSTKFGGARGRFYTSRWSVIITCTVVFVKATIFFCWSLCSRNDVNVQHTLLNTGFGS